MPPFFIGWIAIVIAIYIATLGLPAHASVVEGHSNTITLGSGLAGYWPLDGATTNWLTDTTADSSGNGNTGQLVNMSTTTSPVIGKIGQALKFNGSNEVVRTSPTGFVTATSPRSMAAWIKITTAGSIMVPFVYGSCTPNGGAFGVYIDASNILHFWGCGDDFQTTTTLTTGVWYHIAVVTKNGVSVTVYVNGVAVSTQTVSGGSLGSPSGTSYEEVGSAALVSGSTPFYFVGLVDDVRVYNRALSAQEVGQLYAQGAVNAAHSNTTTLSSGLVGYWTLDGNKTNWLNGTTADSSGNGNTGSLVSMSTTTSPVIGKIGGALNFNSTIGQYVNLGTPSLLEGLQLPVTISGWFKQTSTSGLQPIYAAYSNTSGGNIWSLVRIDNGTLMYYASNSSGVFQNFGTFTPAVGKWHYFSVTVSGTLASPTLTIYLDGASQSVSLGALYATPQPVSIYIGGDAAQLNERFNGAIDDVRIYNRALSANETTQLYALGQVNVAHSNTTSSAGGLVGYWTFDGPKINWATGAVADSSGQGNTGQLVLMSTSTSPTIGKIGQALNFNGGVNNYILLPNSLIQNNTAITTSMWFKTTISGGMFGYQNGAAGATAANYVPMLYVGTDGKLRGEYYQGTLNALTSSGSVMDGKWHHAVLTGNVNTQSLYLDGSLVGTLSGTITNLDMSFNQIGIAKVSGWPSGGNGPFSGAIDDVRIYNRALSAQEVAQLYASTK